METTNNAPRWYVVIRTAKGLRAHGSDTVADMLALSVEYGERVAYRSRTSDTPSALRANVEYLGLGKLRKVV